MEHEGGLDNHVGPEMTPRCHRWDLRGLYDDFEVRSRSRKTILALRALLLDIHNYHYYSYYHVDRSLGATSRNIPRFNI